MKWNEIKKKNWFPYTVAACAGVLFYVTLINLPSIWRFIAKIADYFGTIVLGGAIAYLINPLAKFLQAKVFGKLGKKSWGISCSVAMILVLIAILLVGIAVVPQLVTSAQTFVSNIDTYIESLEKMIADLGLEQSQMIQDLIESSNHILDVAAELISDNISDIISMTANIGMTFANFAIAMILSLYFLAEKQNLKTTAKRLLYAITPDSCASSLISFYHRVDDIMGRYVSFSLLDSLIIGISNAIFMAIANIQYIGLVSVVVGVTNLIPNFGPLIGAVIGGFILLLVNPVHALIFIIFTLILQTADAYIIKPKLFGNSLGVSGLMILSAVIVFGKMFGMVGIILAIPGAAVIQFIFGEVIMPWLESAKQQRRQE